MLPLSLDAREGEARGSLHQKLTFSLSLTHTHTDIHSLFRCRDTTDASDCLTLFHRRDVMSDSDIEGRRAFEYFALVVLALPSSRYYFKACS